VAPKYKWFAVLAVVLTVLDQISKILVRRFMEVGDQIPVIPGFFNLWYRLNPGAAFGLMRDNEYRILIFAVITVVALGVIGFYVRSLRDKDAWLGASLGLIAAGAVGNLIDRILFKKVTDFADVYVGWEGGLQEFLLAKIGTTHYNTFNIADAAIVVGVIMVMIHIIWFEPRQAKADKERAEREKAGKDKAGKNKPRKDKAGKADPEKA
jgi:signal peptidase II